MTEFVWELRKRGFVEAVVSSCPPLRVMSLLDERRSAFFDIKRRLRAPYLEESMFILGNIPCLFRRHYKWIFFQQT